MSATAKLKAKSDLDNKGFLGGIAGMEQAVKRFGAGELKAIGASIAAAFTVGAATNFAKSMLSTADAIDNTAKQLGIGREELQALQRQTELTAGSGEKMTSALLGLTKAQDEALAGEQMQAEAFANIGISIEELKSMSPDQIFERLSKAVNNTTKFTKAAAAAGDILGGNYMELNEVMREVAEKGVRGLADEMLRTNQIMSDKSVIAADKLEEAYNRMATNISNKFKGLALSIISSLSAAGSFAETIFSGGGFDAAVAAASSAKAAFFEGDPIAAKQKAIGNGAAARGEKQRAPGEISTSIADADSLAKIGGVIGPQIDAGRLEAQRQIKIMEQQQKLQEQLNEKMQKVAENTEALKEE